VKGEKMKAKLFVLLLAAVLLSGCATTTKKNNAQMRQLQDRISYLESELDKKNRETAATSEDLIISNDYDTFSDSKSSAKTDAVKSKLSMKEVQTALKNSGLYKGPIDGKIGTKAREAIKQFQKANDLKTDGMVGKRTANKLSIYLK
jgi:outer membrane murein-binding lipoprotein Lpp